MLAAVHPIQGKWQRAVEWGLVPEVTQKDNDALECMVEWWSTLPAKRMRDIAEPLISAAHRKAMSNMFTSQESIV